MFCVPGLVIHPQSLQAFVFPCSLPFPPAVSFANPGTKQQYHAFLKACKSELEIYLQNVFIHIFSAMKVLYDVT